MSHFEYRDPDGDQLQFHPVTSDEDGPAVEVCIKGAPPWITLDRIEEVVTGLRDIARQAGAQQPAADVAPLSDFIDLFGLTDVVASRHEARAAEGAGA